MKFNVKKQISHFQINNKSYISLVIFDFQFLKTYYVITLLF